MDWFLYYFIISGLVTFMFYYYHFDFVKDEEAEDCLADITWSTGFNRDFIKSLLYVVSLLFGCIILPYELGTYIKDFIEGKEE